ncbi:hypothetical protein [Sphingomonas sp.]|uniref:hypothetical protein n=1 Tax=Sphingomonas sp. TaxID=28214 RepID=UPI0038A719E5
MSKVHPSPKVPKRGRIALLSNPQSADSLAELPRLRAYCADHPDVFHYEVEEAAQVSEAMRSIVRVRPALLAINGGEPMVKAALAELGQFGDAPPPLKVIADGKVEGLRRLVEMARSGEVAR